MEIVYSGNVFDISGYAEVSREIIAGLAKLDVRIQLEQTQVPMVKVPLEPELESLLIRSINNRVSRRALVVQTKPAEGFERKASRYNIGITMLEADRLTPQWVAKCNRMDEIWVPSRFNYETFTKSGVQPGKVKVFPFGVDQNRFTPDGPVYPIPGRRGYTFLSVLDWHKRKGWDILVRAFSKVFSEQDDVCLVLKVTNTMGADFSHVPDEIEKISREVRPDPPRIIIWSQNVSRQEMPAFYRAADCFVLPSHGEGWSMPTIEAMAAGLPVVVTNWSGHTEYTNTGVAFMLNVECLEPVPPVDPWNDYVYKGAMWARPSEHHLTVILRSIYENKEGAKNIGRMGREHVLNNFTWDASCQKMFRRLATLWTHFGRNGFYTTL
ncbi:MAG: glycosyltransferase family 4 protein [Firmicutes bacterium]|nr:glycosyltransferase family 4 protein [Bacillota bacterium]